MSDGPEDDFYDPDKLKPEMPSELDSVLSQLFNYLANERVRSFNAGVDQERARANLPKNLTDRAATSVPLTLHLDRAIARFATLMGRVPTGEEIMHLAAANSPDNYRPRNLAKAKRRRKHK